MRNYVISEYLNSLIESKKIHRLFRAGPVQNIKEFTPKIISNYHNDTFRTKSVVYATSDISFASAFCFDWSDKDGFKFGQVNNGKWTFEVPREFEYRLYNKCSMYEIDSSSFIRLNISTPEYLSTSSVKVIKETKYDKGIDCIKDNGVIINIIFEGYYT